MKPLARVCIAFATLISLFAPTSSLAADRTDWACWYQSADYTIRCRLAGAPAEDSAVRLSSNVGKLNSRLPELVRVIRAAPEQLSGQQISIPLWTEPSEMEFASLLAEAVMCGTQSACAVSFDANADGGAALRVAALVASDPEEFIGALSVEQDFATSPFALARFAEPVADKSSTRRRGARRAVGV